MSTGVVQVGDLTKSFSGERVLTDVDLTVEDGEFCVILGPSGCGKSTLLKCIAGILDADGGSVRLNGTDVADVPVRETGVGFVFQEFEDTLFPHMTVEENVAFGLHQRGDLTRSEIRQRVDEMLALLAVTDVRHDRPGELSGGQQQRVELARQLVRECGTVLLDDPLADLDYKLQKRLELELRAIHDDTDSTFVYVTHNQDQALRLADRLVVMNRGEVEQADAPLTVYERPATAFVGRFVGDSNLFRARPETTDGSRASLTTPVGDVEATVRGDPANLPAETVVLVRPEDVTVDDDTASPNSVPGRIEHWTFTGETTEVTVSVPTRDGDRTTLDVVQPGEDPPGDLGSTVTVSWRADDAVCFASLSRAGDLTVDDLEAI